MGNDKNRSGRSGNKAGGLGRASSMRNLDSGEDMHGLGRTRSSSTTPDRRNRDRKSSSHHQKSGDRGAEDKASSRGPPLTDTDRRAGLQRQVSDNSDSMAMLLGLANKKKPRKKSGSDSSSSSSSSSSDDSSISSKASANKKPAPYNPNKSIPAANKQTQAATAASLNLSSHSGEKSSLDTAGVRRPSGASASDMKLTYPATSKKDVQKKKKQQETEPNTFPARRDLREVNQSENLMDVEAGRLKKNPFALGYSNKKKQKKAGMVDGWGDASNSTSAATSLQSGATGTPTAVSTSSAKRNTMLRNKRNPYLKASPWENFTFFLKDSCLSFRDIVFSRYGLLAVVCVMVVVIVVPLATATTTAVKANSSRLNVPVGHEPGPLKAPTGHDTIEQERTVVYLKPTFSTRDVTKRSQLLEQIIGVHGMNSNSTGSAASARKAKEWLVRYDPARIDFKQSDSMEVLQRYALAVLFFSTHPGTSSNRTVFHSVPASNVDGSQDLEDDIVSREQQDERRTDSYGTNWMMDESICTWSGVQCADLPMPNVVVYLNMSHSMLQGTLPPELALLKELKHMDFGHNDLQGKIPEIFTEKLPYLEALWLQDNLLTGVLPENIGKLSHLRYLNLAQNKFSGNIPTSINQLTELQLLYFQENLLSGPIPSLESLNQLQYLYLNHNEFTGELPPDIFKIKSLVDIRMEYNEFVGTLPTELRHLHNLEVLSLGNNELEGTIPDIFKKMKHLVALDLHKNKLVGRLPSSISRLLSLEHLLLDHNALTGWLPTTLFSLARLRTMVLHHNKFYGSIPWEIGGLVQLHDLWLDHNSLTGKIPEELGELETVVNVYLHENDLSGPLPSKIERMKKLASLRLYHNNLSGSVSADMCHLKTHNSLSYVAADCSSKISCKCCDKCY